MEVIFIRHLATPGNEKRQYIGRTDEPLSDRAVTAFREQQEGTEAAAYPDIRFLTASPMRRCVRKRSGGFFKPFGYGKISAG